MQPCAMCHEVHNTHRIEPILKNYDDLCNGVGLQPAGGEGGWLERGLHFTSRSKHLHTLHRPHRPYLVLWTMRSSIRSHVPLLARPASSHFMRFHSFKCHCVSQSPWMVTTIEVPKKCLQELGFDASWLVRFPNFQYRQSTSSLSTSISTSIITTTTTSNEQCDRSSLKKV